eukprot:5394198-Lingulodinium_polyedra.AAC.1
MGGGFRSIKCGGGGCRLLIQRAMRNPASSTPIAPSSRRPTARHASILEGGPRRALGRAPSGQ